MSKEEIIQLIDELGDRLEEPAQRVFELGMRATISGAIIQLAIYTLILGAVLFIVRKGFASKSPSQWSWDKGRDVIPDGWIMAMVISGVIGAFALFLAASAIHTLLNPEWSTLQQLIPGL